MDEHHSNENYDARLRAHIQILLGDYVKTHLTVDHKAFTEQVTERLFSECLKFVPETDSTSLILPPDPLDVLFQNFNISSLKPYDERWIADEASINFIKSTLTSTSTHILKAKSCWHEDDDYGHQTSRCQLMSPILTTRALRETPVFGHGKVFLSIPRTKFEIWKLISFEPINIEDICERTLSCREIDEILHVRHTIEPAYHAGMVELIKSNPFISMSSRSAHISTPIEYFLRSTSPVHLLPRCDSPPLFPRVRSSGCDRSQIVGKSQENVKLVLSSLTEVSVMVPEAAPGSDDNKDNDEQHMAIIDGWVTYGPSSPTLSRISSSSQVDELFVSCSEDSAITPTSKFLLDAKLDEIEIPRSRKSGTNPIPSIAVGKGLQPFILPFLSDTKQPLSGSRVDPKLSPDVSRNLTKDDITDFDFDLNQLCKGVEHDDSRNIVMREQLDVKDMHLMEVPEVPPPTSHPRHPMFYPNSLSVYTTASLPQESSRAQDHARCTGPELQGFLQKVKGIKPLSLELSWMPYRFGSKIPTDEEVSQVDGSCCDKVDPSYEYGFGRVETLLEMVTGLGKDVKPCRGWNNLGLSPMGHPNNAEFGDHCFGLLTRRERERLSNYSVAELDGLDIAAHSDPREGCIENLIDDAVSQAQNLRTLDDAGINARECASLSNQEEEYGRHDWDDLKGRESMLGSPKMQIDSMPLNPAEQVTPKETSQDHTERSSFLPLSFGSQCTPHSSHLTQENLANTSLNSNTLDIPLQDSGNAQDHGSVDLLHFMVMRNKKIHTTGNKSVDRNTEENIENYREDQHYTDNATQSLFLPGAAGLYDENTICLPRSWIPPTTIHRYLASLDFIQKHSLIRSLRSDDCAVDLVERDDLGGVDLILDVDSAIVFVSLLALPSNIKEIVDNLVAQSWRYSHLLVIFEAFSSTRALNVDEDLSNRHTLYAYTPPIQKAVKTFRRVLDISAARQNKNTSTQISVAFADCVHDAAKLARHFGNTLETDDPRAGMFWNSRDWLHDENEGENDLARADGMNPFAALIMLSQRSLDDILDLPPDVRVEEFAYLVGEDRITALNYAIECRTQDIDMEMSEVSPCNTLPRPSTTESMQDTRHSY